MAEDRMKEILTQWASELPELDTRPMAVAGRLLRAADILTSKLGPTFTRHGLPAGGFDVLAALRRSGPPYRLSPTSLYRSLMLSSGTMTHRLDRLESLGLIRRLPDPEDRRGLQIELTETGQSVVGVVVEEHMANERRLLETLSQAEQDTLSHILSKLLHTLERDT